MSWYGRWVRLLGALVCVGTLFALWRFTPLREIVTADAVRHWAETFGRQPWAPLAILLAYTPASVIMFPRPLITLAATVAFGPWLGALYALGGIELAALSGYFAGRGVSRDRLRRFGGPNLNALSARLRGGGLAAMVLVRLLPVAPFVVVSLFAGAARVGLTAFALGTAIGMAPGLIGMTVFGSQVGGALGGDGHFNIWLIAGVFAVIAAISLLARRFALRGNRPERSRRLGQAHQAKSYYPQALKDLGYEITAVNNDESDYVEYEVVKGHDSYEVQIDLDKNTGKAKKVDVTTNRWKADATDKARDRRKE